MTPWWDDDERSRANLGWGSSASYSAPSASPSPSSTLRQTRGDWTRSLCPDADPWVLLRRPPHWPAERYRDHDFEPRAQYNLSHRVYQ